jgi:transglutaminase-like putative cysteine protease
MMHVLQVRHRTTYLYKEPVELGEHRLMSRPRDSHDLRLLDTSLVFKPAAATVRWIHDVFGNSIAIASFQPPPARELTIESGFRAEHYPRERAALLPLEPYARRLPFSYAADDALDLGHSKERHYPDPLHRVDAWAKGFVEQAQGADTLEVLEAMTCGITQQLTYVAREAAGVQTPLETLERACGSCRDFAVLMMEGVRSLGLAAHFVSGYLYDEGLIGAGGGKVGGGSTHAWVSVYLPGAGWVEMDPTHALIGGRNLIRVAVARDASQAAPLTGSYRGPSDALLSMTVDVQVEAQ